MKHGSGQINGKKGGLKSALAGFCPAFKRLSNVPSIVPAMFYIAEALLLTKELSFSSHKGVISNFGREFVKRGVFDKKFQKALSDIFKLRQNCDYDPLPEIDENKTKRALQNAKDFLDEAKTYLEAKG